MSARRTRTRTRRLFLLSVLTASAALTLTGCRGPSVPMEPAPLAAAPECAEVTVRLPQSIDGLELRTTNAQATGAWGTPAAVLLHCGVPTPEPTTAACISVNDVDWIEDDSRAPTYVFTTYGRSPAARVTIDATHETISGLNILTALGSAVSYLPKVGGCVGAEDVPGSSPTP